MESRLVNLVARLGLGMVFALAFAPLAVADEAAAEAAFVRGEYDTARTELSDSKTADALAFRARALLADEAAPFVGANLFGRAVHGGAQALGFGALFQALQQRLQENGATLIAPERETPFDRFFFRDPNGYVFEVIDQQGYCDESS